MQRARGVYSAWSVGRTDGLLAKMASFVVGARKSGGSAFSVRANPSRSWLAVVGQTAASRPITACGGALAARVLLAAMLFTLSTGKRRSPSTNTTTGVLVGL